MKTLIRIVLIAVPVLLVVAVVVVLFSLNSIIRSTVQTQATASLNVPTTLGGASVSLLGGSLGLSELAVGSPKGFQAAHILTLGRVGLDVNYGQLTKDPVRVREISLDRPVLVVEQAGGKFNFKALIDQLPRDPDTQGDGKRDKGEPIRLIVDTVTITGASVSLRPGIPGLAGSIDVPLPAMTLQNIGTADGAQNGVAIKELTLQVITAMVAKAAESDKVPPEIRQLLTLDLKQVAGRVGAELKKQFGDLAEDPLKAAGEILKDPDSLKEKGKKPEEGLKGIFPPGRDRDKQDEPLAPPRLPPRPPG